MIYVTPLLEIVSIQKLISVYADELDEALA